MIACSRSAPLSELCVHREARCSSGITNRCRRDSSNLYGCYSGRVVRMTASRSNLPASGKTSSLPVASRVASYSMTACFPFGVNFIGGGPGVHASKILRHHGRSLSKKYTHSACVGRDADLHLDQSDYTTNNSSALLATLRRNAVWRQRQYRGIPPRRSACPAGRPPAFCPRPPQGCATKSRCE